MGKYADRYFKINPWLIIEEEFNPEYSQVAESIFSLGNEYTGLRGYFDEGYSGKSLQGSYMNGVYERRMLPKSGYKGMLPYTDFMVNTVDWVYTRITCNGRSLDLNKCRFAEFRRVLDMRSGVLSRRFIWQVDDITSLELSFERFTSMAQEQFVGQKIILKALSGKADVTIRAGLDFTRPHMSVKGCMFEVESQQSSGRIASILATTKTTRQSVYAAAKFTGIDGIPCAAEDGIASNLFNVVLNSGESASLERVATLLSARNDAERDTLGRRIDEAHSKLETADYETLKADSARWWKKQWSVSDIEIIGDEENQQGIRFCVFQMHQTLHTAKYGAVFGAKGLTGEAYNGNTFWDSEVCCLPFYLFNNPEAAKSFLKFRYDTLTEAKERAADLDCRGAFYPIATISGRECCDLWQHASLQPQASTGVAYGLWNYVHQTGDHEFLYEYGAEMLVEISRMLASRGDTDPVTGKYGYYCVMGPDEFQMMVHHNAYTNFMGQKVLRFTLETLAQMKKDDIEGYCRLNVLPEELADWQDKADRMHIPYDETTKLFEQHMGYFHLPVLDVGSIPVEEFPLYSHWSYERIYRNSMIKQPDVLMFMMLYGSEFSREQLEANFDFYEPRCIHESSLSPSIHSILACRLGRMEKAESLFDFATRMDLDNYNRNTHEGLHTTSIAGAWMNIVYGFGGLRSDADILTIAPCIPQGWGKYTFSVCVNESVLRVTVTQSEVTVEIVSGEAVPLCLYDKRIIAKKQAVSYVREDCI